MLVRAVFAVSILAGASLAAPPAFAQQAETRMEAGLRIAMRRGAHDPQCYASVFARHARWGMRPDGTMGWRVVNAGPPYNQEMRRVCGINRGGLVRAERRAARRFGIAPFRGADPGALPY